MRPFQFFPTAFWHIAYWLFLLIYVANKIVNLYACTLALTFSHPLYLCLPFRWGVADKTIILKCLTEGPGPAWIRSALLDSCPEGTMPTAFANWRCRTFLVMMIFFFSLTRLPLRLPLYHSCTLAVSLPLLLQVKSSEALAIRLNFFVRAAY